MALDGDAIVRHGDYVLFVGGAIPGEEVDVEVVSTGRKFGRARLVSVVKPSPHRVAPRCPHFGPCGGCAWQHIAYPEQLRLKAESLANALRLALGGEVPVGPTVGLDRPWGFRSKVHFVVGRGDTGDLVVGHYRVRSKELLPVEECPVHSERGNAVAFRLRDILGEEEVPPVAGDQPGTGVARHILVRASERSGEAQAVLVSTRRKFPGLEEVARKITAGPGGASGFHLSTNSREGSIVLGSFTRKVAGRDRLLEEVAGVRFLVSPVSFFQTSARAAERLVDLVMAAVGPARSVLDLYSGSGLFALPLAGRGSRVLAVEENPHAVEDGIETARFNRIRGVRFLTARSEDILRRLGRRGGFDAAILDPPREGASPAVLAGLGRLRPGRIIYVSCDPRALARDLRILTGAGWRLAEVRAVDMFPHTAHVEAVAVLEPPPWRQHRHGDGGETGMDRETEEEREAPRRSERKKWRRP